MTTTTDSGFLSGLLKSVRGAGHDFLKQSEHKGVRIPLHLDPRDYSQDAVWDRYDLHVKMMEITGGKGFRRPRTGKHKKQRRITLSSISRADKLAVMAGL